MVDFEFHSPTKIFFGKDAHLKTADIIKSYGFDKIMLHYGQGSVIKSGLYAELTGQLDKAGIKYVDFGGVEPNPKLSLVKKGIGACRENGVQMILAVGGGSVIDSAKLISIGAVNDGDPWLYSLREKTAEKSLPVGTVLTLSASGSEMSDSCVITNESSNDKRGFSSEQNRPLFSICNPCLTYTVNKYQTACGIVDIMMHTLERFFAVSEPLSITDSISKGLLKTVIEYGRRAIDNPGDYEARANLMWAGSVSHNGLTGLSSSYVMICHQIEHELSGRFDSVAHGAGLSVIFPAWARFIYKYRPQRFAELAEDVWGINRNGLCDEELALRGIDAAEEYFKSIGMPVRLDELGINADEKDIDIMSEKCTYYGKRVLNDYIELKREEIAEIFRIAGGDLK